MSVSILLPVYNAERYIAKAIESVLGQSFKNFELIIINDGSTDSTSNICSKYAEKDERIRVVNQSNQGMAASLNYGLKITNYPLIARIDADDLMHINRLERQFDYMKNNPDVAIVGSYVYYINDKGVVIGRGKTDFLSTFTIQTKINNNYIIGLNHPTVMMRKNVILEVGGYRGEYWPADDIDLWNRVVEKGFRIDIIPEYLTYYRIHNNSVSITSAKNSILKAKWVKYNLIKRRSGENEVSFEEFIKYLNGQNILCKFNTNRKLLGQIFYKKSIQTYSNKKIYNSILNILLALFLHPKYTINKLITRI